MNVYMLLYNGFVEFEVTVSLMALRRHSTLHTFSIDEKMVKSYCGLSVEADMILEEVNPADIDLLLIPGGEPKSYKNRDDVQNLIQIIHSRGTPIAAICGGPEFLAQAGVIKNRRITHSHEPEYGSRVFHESTITNEDVVVDGNIITARGQAYVEFAVEIGKQLGIFENEDDALETQLWFKNSV
ncbi:MAG: DJ-1/PfpI family protein [Candidatus Thorarchaeota archaeon]